MEALFNFLANNYIIFAIISVVLIFAIIGFIVKIKKDKLKGVQTADAVAQPLVADDNNAPVQEEVREDLLNTTTAPVEMAPAKEEEMVIAPSLEGLDSNAELDNANAPMLQKTDNTLVLDPNASEVAFDTPINQTDAALAGGNVDLPNDEPVEAPMLIIEDPSAKKEEAPAETPQQPQQ